MNFFSFSLTQHDKIVNKIDRNGNAHRGKTLEATWLKVSDLIGKSFSELLKYGR
jgi:hypothetical protein